jgi:hypothetical protein
MTTFGNYTQVLTDMVAAIQNANLGFAKVFKNASDIDCEYNNMPMCDVRMKRAIPQLVSLPSNYYVELIVEIEVGAFHMTSRDQAAIMRDNLVDAVQALFRQTPRFGGYVEDTIVGAVEFETGENAAQGEFVAAALAQFHVKFYAN